MISKSYSSNKSGFTLIELLVVIAIISLLSSIVLSSLNSARVKARDATRKAQFAQIVRALELYYDAYGKYPPFRASSSCGGNRNDFASSLCSVPNWLTTDDNFLSFIPIIPVDPVNRWGNDDMPWWFALSYAYGVSTSGQEYDLLVNLENTSDSERCELKLWHSNAVWPSDTGCYSTATVGTVPDRAKQIYSNK